MDNAKAREFARKASTARDLAPIVAELQAAGTTSLRGIATALNERGIPTARGRGEWEATKVRRVLADSSLGSVPVSMFRGLGA
jgi:Recombinase